jgi:hypothetical protein
MFSVARRAAGRSLGLARSAMEPRVVTTSATQGAAAAAAAPAMKPANMQEFQIYRWDPDTGGKPRYQSYQVRVVECTPFFSSSQIPKGRVARMAFSKRCAARLVRLRRPRALTRTNPSLCSCATTLDCDGKK